MIERDTDDAPRAHASKTRTQAVRKDPLSSAVNHTVPPGRIRLRQPFPGTSCQATINCPSRT
jgi:hypothetical protein